jgi:formate hydrogenlyase subunit 4
VGLLELFLAVLITGISAVNAAMPVAAWGRARDARFLLLAAANLLLAVLGVTWVWGQLPVNPPTYTDSHLPELGMVLAATVFLLAATLWPRRV